jgi:hypothetical protein
LGDLSFALVMRSIEFRTELRLYAARRFLEFSFSLGDMSQHGVQPLGPQYDESEQQHEKYFRSETHGSLLG